MFHSHPRSLRQARGLATLATLTAIACAAWATVPGRAAALGTTTVSAQSILTAAPLTPTPSVAAQVLPPQGLYEECAPSNPQQCDTELAQMSTAGFRLVINYTVWSGSAAQIQAYAAEAQAMGIKVIWPLDFSAWRDSGSASTLLTAYPALAADCGCTTNSGFMTYVIDLVRGLPATWGYYIGDELAPSQAPATAALAAATRALDPTHQLLYIAAGGPQTVGNLTPFAGLANVAGADVYPIGQEAPTSYVGTVAASVAQITKAAATHSAMVVQAFSWGQYPTELQAPDPRWPTRAEMLAMRNQALTASPSMILWYSLKDILDSDNPAAHWSDVVSAAFAPTPAPAPPVAKAPAAPVAKTPAKTPATPVAKTPAKPVAKTPAPPAAKTPAKTPAPPTAKTPAPPAATITTAPAGATQTRSTGATGTTPVVGTAGAKATTPVPGTPRRKAASRRARHHRHHRRGPSAHRRAASRPHLAGQRGHQAG
jgi:hypothetical protein